MSDSPHSSPSPNSPTAETCETVPATATNSGRAPRGKRKALTPQQQVIAEAKQRQFFSVREEFVRKYNKSKHPDFRRAAEYHAHVILRQNHPEESENEVDILDDNIIQIDDNKLDVFQFQSVPWYHWHGLDDWPQPALLAEEFTQQYREYKVLQERRRQHRLGWRGSPGSPGQRARQQNSSHARPHDSSRIRKRGQHSKPTIYVRPADVTVVGVHPAPIINPPTSPTSSSPQQQPEQEILSIVITPRTDLRGARYRYRSVKAAQHAIAAIHIRNRIAVNEAILKALAKGGVAAAYELKQRLHKIPFLGDILASAEVNDEPKASSRAQPSPPPPPPQQQLMSPPRSAIPAAPAAPITAPNPVPAPQNMTMKSSEQIWEEFVTRYGYSEALMREWYANNVHVEQTAEMLNRWYEHVWRDYDGQM
ncbi:hypothetical protein VTN31DRAFT_6690 [Thermomyces dupontii]|uniref:uncharacterized protein n=1 Tax=Talaromyces thermophilus TaxID=28565 RepID=UPI003743CC3B